MVNNIKGHNKSVSPEEQKKSTKKERLGNTYQINVKPILICTGY